MEYRNFKRRHVGLNDHTTQEMINYLGYKTIDELIEQTVPDGIRYREVFKARI